MSEWIDVNDRTPSEPGIYKCKMRVGSMSPKVIETDVSFHHNRFREGDWETVTHWKEPMVRKLSASFV